MRLFGNSQNNFRISRHSRHYQTFFRLVSVLRIASQMVKVAVISSISVALNI